MTEILPSGVVTIMFTDLVDSTAIADRLGDEAAKVLLRAHDRILRQQFERFDGKVVKGTGDGFLVAFTSPRQGVECALEVQHAIATQHAEGRYPELQVRIGLHTGEPTVEGGDLSGGDVNLAARIEAEAAGGQILVSDITRQLAVRQPGLEFMALGPRLLKGFAEPVALFEVRSPEKRVAGQWLTRFIGREEEAAQLRQLLDVPVRGQGKLVLVCGEAGVGKTRLVSEFAIYAADRGLEVLTGRAYETEGMPAYLPITEPLSQYVRMRSTKELQEELNGNAPYVAKLLPELRQLLPDLREPPALSPEGERYRLFDGVTDFLLAIARRRPLLLFLDDLHWADGASLLLLEHLARRISEGPLIVVGTYRDMEVGAEHPLSVLLAEMARQHLGSRISLRPFVPDEASALAGAVLGTSPAPRVADALFAATEGNPFFTEELVRHLIEQGRDLADAGADVARWEVPEGVRQVIGRRLARLSPEANRLLAYSSVLGRDLSVSKVAAVTNKGEDAVLDLLDEAEAAHVLREGPEGYSFAHPLINETLYKGLTAPRRRQLHRRVAEGLEKLYRQDVEPHLAELAYHFCEAAPGGDVDKAIDYARRAADRALVLLAYEEAASWYQMALQALELKQLVDEGQCCDLLLALGDAELKAGVRDKAEETFAKAAEEARKQNDAQRLARAAVGYADPEVPALTEAAVRLLDEALEAMGNDDSALRSQLLTLLGREQFSRGDIERGRSFNRQAMAIARRVGDPQALHSALLYGSYHFVLRDNAKEVFEEQLAAGDEMIRLAQQTGDKAMALDGQEAQIRMLLWLGRVDTANEAMEAYARLAEELRRPFYLWVSALFKAGRALFEGRLDEAERLAHEALAVGQRSQNRIAMMNFAIQLANLRREQGRLGETEGLIKASVQLYPLIPAMRTALAAVPALYAEIGREEEGRKEFEALAENGFALFPRDSNWPSAMILLTRACYLLDDGERAALLYEHLRPYAEFCVLVGMAADWWGSTSESLGMLATTMSRWDEAEGHFRHALEANIKMGSGRFIGWTRYRYAEMLLRRGAPDDREKADGLLKEALAAAREMGMKALAEKAEALRCEIGTNASL